MHVKYVLAIKNDKEDSMSDNKLFIKPNVVFNNNFEKRVAEGNELDYFRSHIRKLEGGKYDKLIKFILNYPYTFFYGIIGSLIFGIVPSLVYIVFGFFADYIIKQIKVGNEYYSQNNGQYKKYRTSFFFQDCFSQILKLWAAFFLMFVLYFVVTKFLVNDYTWYSHMKLFTDRIALLVPAIDKHKEFLLENGHNTLALRVTNLEAISWFIIFLLVPFFLQYTWILIKNFRNWHFNYELLRIKEGTFKIMQFFSFVILLFPSYLSVKISFLGSVFVFFAEGPFAISILLPILCIVFFILTSLSSIAMIKLITNEYRN